jgi:hypothetical protein
MKIKIRDFLKEEKLNCLIHRLKEAEEVIWFSYNEFYGTGLEEVGEIDAVLDKARAYMEKYK